MSERHTFKYQVDEPGDEERTLRLIKIPFDELHNIIEASLDKFDSFPEMPGQSPKELGFRSEAHFRATVITSLVKEWIRGIADLED